MQTTTHTEKKTPVCYPYLSGFLQQRISVSARELVAKQLVDPMAVWAVQAHMDSIIREAHEKEREYSIG